jgi:hypothetical protein
LRSCPSADTLVGVLNKVHAGDTQEVHWSE